MRKIVLNNEEKIARDSKKIQALKLDTMRSLIEHIPRGVTLHEVKCAYIDHVIKMNSGVKTEAAKELDVNYGTLVRFFNTEISPIVKKGRPMKKGKPIGDRDDV